MIALFERWQWERDNFQEEGEEETVTWSIAYVVRTLKISHQLQTTHIMTNSLSNWFSKTSYVHLDPRVFWSKLKMKQQIPDRNEIRSWVKYKNENKETKQVFEFHRINKKWCLLFLLLFPLHHNTILWLSSHTPHKPHQHTASRLGIITQKVILILEIVHTTLSHSFSYYHP